MSRMPDPEKRQEWTRRLLEFDRGQWTVVDFCRREGVSTATFYQWKRKLGREIARGFGTRAATPAVKFMPVEITDQGANARGRIEVHLTNGTRLLVPCHDQAVIRAVIGALVGDVTEDRAC